MERAVKTVGSYYYWGGESGVEVAWRNVETGIRGEE